MLTITILLLLFITITIAIYYLLSTLLFSLFFFLTFAALIIFLIPPVILEDLLYFSILPLLPSHRLLTSELNVYFFINIPQLNMSKPLEAQLFLYSTSILLN